MRKTLLIVIAAGTLWWTVATPRAEISIAPSVRLDRSTADAIAAIDKSAEFAGGLQHFPSSLAGFDDVVFPGGDGQRMIVTGGDGKIWNVNPDTHAAEPLIDPPLMAYGIHEAPGDAGHVYVCSSRSYANSPPEERVGLYRVSLDTRAVEPLVVDVPVTDLRNEHPIVYPDDDANAPELRRGDAGNRRPLLVCDNLEASADGKRIYFSEPFDYSGASVDDAVDEAIALAPNGRLWRHDLETGSTRLIAEGFHFINGVLYDPHPGLPREESVIVNQTSHFRLTRFYLRGPKAGTSEVVLDGITGMNDGMDRDANGRIWLALFAEGSSLLTWAHAHAWVKPLLMRLPAKLLLGRPRRTGVLVLSPDGRTALYSALYEGPLLTSIASAVPSPRGVYLANLALGDRGKQQTGIVRLQWPSQLP
jgi:sugar lactone lactonase YvrE